MPKPRSSQSNRNTIRIIGGSHRGRRLSFPDVEGLRPTPDRVRETVFNWLQHELRGARCLDLFAGSGALGLEASSRGAAHVDLVEKDQGAAQMLRENVELLGCDATVHHQGAMSFLNSAGQYDVIFLDPPFRKGWLETILPLVREHLSDDGIVYVEREGNGPALATGWRTLKEKRAGDVIYALIGPA